MHAIYRNRRSNRFVTGVNSTRLLGGNELLLEEDKLVEDEGLTSYSIEKLKKILEKAIEQEDYEQASEIRDEIKKRKKK